MYINKEPHSEIARIYSEIMGRESTERNVIRRIQKWKAKMLVDEELKEDITLTDHRLHNATVQYSFDENGKAIPIQAWGKTKPEENDRYNQILEAISKLKPIRLEKTTTNNNTVDSLLEIPLPDMHFGIGTYKLYRNKLQEMVEIIQNKQRKKIILLMAQDLFHNNDFKGNTSNGTPIEKVDMVKAWEDAYNFYYELINTAYDHAQEVEVIYSRGNHDESMAWAFVKMLEKLFPDIKFDTSLDDVKARKYGEIFIGWSHSDKGKKKISGSNKKNNADIRGVFAERFKMMWATTSVREIHLGHLHHEWAKDLWGFVVRHLSSGVPTDEYHDINDWIANHKRFQLFEYSTKKLKTIHYI